MINPEHLEAMADWLEPHKGHLGMLGFCSLGYWWCGWCAAAEYKISDLLARQRVNLFLKDLFCEDSDWGYYMAEAEFAEPGTRVTILRELAYALREQGFADE